ncbi:apolipoprotein L3-like isoform X1 [Peromyscus maniculatus bairdii]|uniref:apolipoprotein L3-like isoform X1 n=2 Tax=Peromyscus maniculatus bairdii TaxID=230844 RepID=UPI00042AB7CB|nr:apolipoprotein L3-like isoform X1 [Peromyscus maniculatus bairdii]
MGSPEMKHFIKYVVEYLLETWSTEDLHRLLTEEEAWKQLVAEADLSREEEVFLRKALEEIIADDDVEDEDSIQNDLQDKKRFLEVYPQVKLELEQQIGKLRALADKIDKVHRDCTITQVVAGSTGAVSGVLTILGLALAPVTAGLSLGLSATGLGLGAAAAVTSVSTTIVEKVSTASVEAEASQLVPTSKDPGKVIKEILEESAPRLFSVSKNSFRNLEVIKKNIDAIKLAKANTRLASNAKRLMTTGRVSARNTRQVQKAFGGTALAMSKGARIMGAATAGLFLVLDVINLVQDSKHLYEGAKTESAAKLRQQAQNLKQKLQELIRVHDSLTK